MVNGWIDGWMFVHACMPIAWLHWLDVQSDQELGLNAGLTWIVQTWNRTENTKVKNQNSACAKTMHGTILSIKTSSEKMLSYMHLINICPMHDRQTDILHFRLIHSCCHYHYGWWMMFCHCFSHQNINHMGHVGFFIAHFIMWFSYFNDVISVLLSHWSSSVSCLASITLLSLCMMPSSVFNQEFNAWQWHSL